MIVIGTESRIYIDINYINLDDDHSNGIIIPISCMIDRFSLNVEFIEKKIPLTITSHTFEYRFFIDHFLLLVRR